MSYGRKINPGGYPVAGRQGENGGVLFPDFYTFTAIAGQTLFDGMSPFTTGENLVYVWKNSEFMIRGEEFAESSTTSITLTAPAIAGDRINVIVFYVGANSSGWPTGILGGVLSGTLPNPGFAVDMATQVELNQLAADIALLLDGKEPDIAAGTTAQYWRGDKTWQDFSAAVRSAVLAGFVASPNTPVTAADSLIVALGKLQAQINAGGGGGGSSAKRILIVGDSESGTQGLLADSWPMRLQDMLNSSGADVVVYNLAINGHTFFRANTVASFGSQTVRDATIAAQPHAVFVVMGVNDDIMNVDGRTPTQTKADALDFFTALRTALPTVPLIYGSEVPYDVTHGTPATLTNRQVLPAHFQLPTSGILTNTYCSEMMADPVSSTNRTRYGNWATLDTYIKGLSQVSGTFDFPLWRAARLGLTGVDALHLTAAGHRFCAGAAREAFQTISALSTAFPNLSDQNYGSFNEPNYLFNLMLTDIGAEWAEPLDPGFESIHPTMQSGPFRDYLPSQWFYPSKGTYKPNKSSIVSGDVFSWTITGALPLSKAQASLNGAAFFDVGYTDGRGNFHDAGAISIAAGSYLFRYKIGNEVFGPFTLTVAAGGTVAAAAHGSYKNLQGSYLNLAGGFTEVFYATTPTSLKNGMVANPGSGAVGPSFTVPRTGNYNIKAQAMNINTAAQGNCLLQVIRTRSGIDAPIAVGQTIFTTLASGAMTHAVDIVEPLLAGDSIRIKTFSLNSSNQNNNADNTANWFSVTEVL